MGSKYSSTLPGPPQSNALPKKQHLYYSGKKHQHTVKGQVIIDAHSGQFICVAHAPGQVHDFKVLKESGIHLHEQTLCLADKGYQGLVQRHGNSCIPKRKPPKQVLSNDDKQCNRALSGMRIGVEHQIGRLKVFRMLKGPYRNRRRRLGLRLNLLCGLLNAELALDVG
jgi:hypothetical protein